MRIRIPCTSIIFLSLIFSQSAKAQEIVLGLQTGYATFGMKDMKDFQKEINSYYPIDSKITESFPGYVNFSINLILKEESFYYGLVFGHTSTAGRISYSDYSGSMTSDQLIRVNYFGGTFGKKITQHNDFTFFLKSELLYCFNKLDFVETITVAPETISSTEKFHSINLNIGLYIEVQRRLKNVQLTGNIGGELQIPGKVVYNADDKFHLVNASNEEVKINASGLRVNIGVAYLFAL